MKRNRLIRPSRQANIFSTASRFSRKSRLLVLSLLAITGIFITSMVLATSQPVTHDTQSQVIDLPNLPAEMQALSTNTKSEQTRLALPNIDKVESVDRPTANNTDLLDEQHSAELAAIEQQSQQGLFAKIKKAISEPKLNWQQITVKSGDNLSLIFPRVGLTARDVYNVAQLGDDIKPLLNLRPGQIMRFGFSSEQASTSLQKLQLELSPIQTLEVTATADGYQATLLSREIEIRQAHASGTIESSLFEAGIEAGLSDSMVMELAYIFGWDIDFALDLRQGDTFKLLFEQEYLDGDKIADGVILAAEFTNRGQSYRAIRYTDDAGLSRYYSPEGDSMRKTFSRSPVHFSRISSRFNPNRKHPVLNTNRPHKGVDYAAATGTPILATGDGKVEFVGRKGGYGRTVILTHGGKYTTLYAHMSSYKKGMKRGKRVQQGDTIGYIGSSGLATGPHLHYEFRINGVHRNPLTVNLPKAEPLPKKYQSDFKDQAQPLLAQLDSLNSAILALAN